MNQVGRTDPMAAVEVNIAFSTVPSGELQFDFQVNIFLGMSLVYKNLYREPAVVRVYLGCYEAEYLKPLLLNSSHPNLYAFNETSATLELTFNSSSATGTSFNLSNLLDFITNQEKCGAYTVRSYSDQALTYLTNSSVAFYL